jgi:hypothetical protein
MSRLTILNQHGDQVLTWDPQLKAAIEGIVTTKEAEKAFNDMKKAGYLAYKQDANGANAEVINKFDQEAEEIVMSPAMQGG